MWSEIFFKVILSVYEVCGCSCCMLLQDDIHTSELHGIVYAWQLQLTLEWTMQSRNTAVKHIHKNWQWIIFHTIQSCCQAADWRNLQTQFKYENTLEEHEMTFMAGKWRSSQASQAQAAALSKYWMTIFTVCPSRYFMHGSFQYYCITTEWHTLLQSLYSFICCTFHFNDFNILSRY